jgi:hypothetical protein
MVIQVFRYEFEEKQVLGECFITENGVDLFKAKTLERADDDNKPNISCIPSGTYKCVLEYSAKFKRELWEIKGVENRSECKFHSANYWHDLNGCIALGTSYADIDKDSFRDVLNSSKTMKKFHSILEPLKEIELIIH